jgi:hypothetical protein
MAGQGSYPSVDPFSDDELTQSFSAYIYASNSTTQTSSGDSDATCTTEPEVQSENIVTTMRSHIVPSVSPIHSNSPQPTPLLSHTDQQFTQLERIHSSTLQIHPSPSPNHLNSPPLGKPASLGYPTSQLNNNLQYTHLPANSQLHPSSYYPHHQTISAGSFQFSQHVYPQQTSPLGSVAQIYHLSPTTDDILPQSSTASVSRTTSQYEHQQITNLPNNPPPQPTLLALQHDPAQSIPPHQSRKPETTTLPFFSKSIKALIPSATQITLWISNLPNLPHDTELSLTFATSDINEPEQPNIQSKYSPEIKVDFQVSICLQLQR